MAGLRPRRRRDAAVITSSVRFRRVASGSVRLVAVASVRLVAVRQVGCGCVRFGWFRRIGQVGRVGQTLAASKARGGARVAGAKSGGRRRRASRAATGTDAARTRLLCEMPDTCVRMNRTKPVGTATNLTEPVGTRRNLTEPVEGRQQMGWLGGFLKRVGGAAPEEMVFAPSVAAPALPGIGEPIVADECYVELFVESLRLTEARRFASRFNGVVYSFVTLAREGEANAQLAAVSKPDKLTEIDDTSLDKVITVSKQMMAAVPWRGGALEPRDRSLLGQDRKPAVADPGLRHPCLVGGRHQLCRRSEAVSPAHHRRHGPDHRPARGHGGRGRARHRPRAPPERGAGNRRRAEGQHRRGEALARRRPPAAPRWSSSRQRLLRVLHSTGGTEGRLRRDSGAEGEVRDAPGRHPGEQGRRCPGRDDGVPARDHRVARF